jgi:imidazolonepropionase-like amidohydrolase
MPAPKFTRRQLICTAAGASLLPRSLWASTETILSNGVLVMPDGRQVRGGIAWAGDKITALGPEVVGGEDLAGRWVVPGFTDAGCRLGLVEVGLESSTHDTSAHESIALDARVIDGYNPRSELIPVARVNGITQVVVTPDLSGMVPGHAALVRTDRFKMSDVVIQESAGLCMSLGRAGQGHDGPKSRIALMKAWRTFFEDHPKPGGKTKKGAELQGDKRIGADLRQGKIRALIRAHRADDIERALDLIATHELKAVLVGCVEGHLVADAIADAGVPVLLGPIDAQPSNFEHPHARYENAAILHEKGVNFAFRTGDAHGVRKLPYLAGLAVAHGLPWEAAIRALTVNPMDIFGQPNLGRLAVGAEPTFFVVDGDPLQPRHKVHHVYIAGQSTSMNTRHTRLFDQFRELH